MYKSNCIKCFFCFLSIGLGIYSQAQHPVKKVQTIDFDEQNELASNTINDIVIDDRHQCFVIAGGVLQYFNGFNFSTIDQGVWGRFQDVEERYILGDTLFSYLDSDKRALHEKIPKKTSTFRLLKDSSKPIFFKINNSNQIEILDSIEWKYFPLNQNYLFSHYFLAGKSGNGILSKNKFIVFDSKNNTTKTITLNENASFFDFKIIDENLLYWSVKGDIIVHHMNQGFDTKTGIKTGQKNGVLRIGIKKYTENEYILFANDRLYVLNKNFRLKYEIRTTLDKPISPSHINAIAIDKYKNIYLATLLNGVIKVINNNLPIKFYGFNEENSFFVKSIHVDKHKNQVLLASWGKGIFIFDTLNNLKQKVIDPEFKDKYTASYFIKISESEFLLDLFRQPYFYKLKLKNGIWNMEKTDISNGGHFNISTSTKADGTASYTLEFDNLLLVKNKEFKFIKLPVQEMLSHVFIKDKLVIGSINELKVLDTLKFKVQESIKTKFGFSYCLYHLDSDNVLLGAANGLYKFNVVTNQLTTYYIKNLSVFAIIKGIDNALWVSTSKGICKIDTYKNISWYSKFDGLQDWEFNSNAVFQTEDGELYFGGLKGANSFYPQQMKRDDQINYFIDRITTFNHDFNYRFASGSTLSLASIDRSVTIYLNCSGSLLPSQYNKQYYIDKLSDEWIDLKYEDKLTQVLDYGIHKIYYHVGHQFDPNAPLENFIVINIKTPITHSWWFILLSVLGAAVAVFSLLFYYQKLKFEKSKAEWETKETLMKERGRMSKELHDFIGAQLSIISRNIGWIKEHRKTIDEKVLAEKLDQIDLLSSKTNTDIRDSIWATKAESISLDELIVRIKNFSFSINNEHFMVEVKNDCPNVQLTSSTAINILRICQEAINNALKYSKVNRALVWFQPVRDTTLPLFHIIDFGVGFDVLAEVKSNGLINMKERAQEINYTLNILSSNEGTQITLTPNM